MEISAAMAHVTQKDSTSTTLQIKEEDNSRIDSKVCRVGIHPL